MDPFYSPTMRKNFILIPALFLLCTSPLWAQSELPEGVLPDSIVVTATRVPISVRDAGQRISAWTDEDIAQLSVNSFDELLRTVGGVEVFSRTGFGVQSDITMRGSTFNGVLVLIDGMPMNDAHTGHFVTDMPLPLTQIKRIEVLRGPAAMLHGPDALGGVIHILTDATVNPEPLGPTSGGLIGIQRGSHGLFDMHGDGVIRKKNVSLGIASIYQQSDGESIENQDGPIIGPNGAVKTDFWRLTNSVFSSATFSRFSAFARLGMDRRDFNAFHFYTISALDFSREQTDTYWAQVRLQNRLNAPIQWNGQVVWKRHDDTFTFNPQFSTNRHTSQHLFSQFHFTRALSSTWTFTTGVSGGIRSITSNNLGDHQDGRAGIFAVANAKLIERLSVYAGSRIDYDSGFGVEVIPQFSLLWRPGPWAIRTNIGRAVRAPNYTERYINTTAPPQRDRNYGNPDLEAERAWSYEAGLDLYPAQGISLHATGFRRMTSNLIDFAQRAPSSIPMLADSVLLALNIVEVDLKGIELDAVVNRPVGEANLNLSATYTYFDSELEGLWPDATFKYASGHGRNIVQVSTSLAFLSTTLGSQLLWKEKLDGTSYSTINLRATQSLQLKRNTVKLTLDLRNVLDEFYTEVLDAPMPGRWISFGAHLYLGGS